MWTHVIHFPSTQIYSFTSRLACCIFFTFQNHFLFLSFLFLSLHLSFSIIRPHPQEQIVSLPALAAPKKDHQQEQTSVDPSVDHRTKATEQNLGRGMEHWSRAGEDDWRKGTRSDVERGGGRGGWSWTVGESRCNAQWVRQKHEYRSTRPWWRHAVEREKK